MQARSTLTFFLSLWILCILVSSAPAQVANTNLQVVKSASAALLPEQPLIPTLRTSVQEVTLTLSVTDHRGRFVGGLQPSDLTILDNNEKQSALTFFQRQTDLPLDVALLVDVSSSVAGRFDQERNTIKQFIRDVARREDKVFLFAFNQRLVPIGPITNNWKQMARKTSRLNPGGETALLDAVASTAGWLAQDHRPARRIIILITDGEENSSKTTLPNAITQVLKAEASIYAVNVSLDDFDEDGRLAAATLKQLADQTGGLYLQDKRDQGEMAFDKIRRELRSQYALAYRPSDLAAAAFHKIEIVAPKKLRVRCRSGYYVR